MISTEGKDIIPRIYVQPDLPASDQVRRLAALDWAVGQCPRAGGAPTGSEAPPPPWDLKNTIFSGFLPLNYVICIFQVFFKLFVMWEN